MLTSELFQCLGLWISHQLISLGFSIALPFLESRDLQKLSVTMGVHTPLSNHPELNRHIKRSSHERKLVFPLISYG